VHIICCYKQFTAQCLTDGLLNKYTRIERTFYFVFKKCRVALSLSKTILELSNGQFDKNI